MNIYCIQLDHIASYVANTCRDTKTSKYGNNKIMHANFSVYEIASLDTINGYPQY